MTVVETIQAIIHQLALNAPLRKKDGKFIKRHPRTLIMHPDDWWQIMTRRKGGKHKWRMPKRPSLIRNIIKAAK